MAFVKNLFENATGLVKHPFEDRGKEEGKLKKRASRNLLRGRSEQIGQQPAIERSRLLGSSELGGS